MKTIPSKGRIQIRFHSVESNRTKKFSISGNLKERNVTKILQEHFFIDSKLCNIVLMDSYDGQCFTINEFIEQTPYLTRELFEIIHRPNSSVQNAASPFNDFQPKQYFPKLTKGATYTSLGSNKDGNGLVYNNIAKTPSITSTKFEVLMEKMGRGKGPIHRFLGDQIKAAGNIGSFYSASYHKHTQYTQGMVNSSILNSQKNSKLEYCQNQFRYMPVYQMTREQVESQKEPIQSKIYHFQGSSLDDIFSFLRTFFPHTEDCLLFFELTPSPKASVMYIDGQEKLFSPDCDYLTENNKILEFLAKIHLSKNPETLQSAPFKQHGRSNFAEEDDPQIEVEDDLIESSIMMEYQSEIEKVLDHQGLTPDQKLQTKMKISEMSNLFFYQMDAYRRDVISFDELV